MMNFSTKFDRALLGPALVMLTLLIASPSQAQYANRSLGLGIGYMKINADAEPVDWGVPLILQGTTYIDNGFEGYANFHLMILTERVTNRQVIGIAGHAGVRYLFSEDSFRPYFGLELGYLQVFRQTKSDLLGSPISNNFGGPGANVGFEYFTSPTLSLGAQAFFDLFWALNQPLRNLYGAQGMISAHF